VARQLHHQGRQHQHDGVVEEQRRQGAGGEHQCGQQRERAARAARGPARHGAEGAGLGQRLVEQHQTEEQRQDLGVDQRDRLVQVDDAGRQQRRRSDQREARAVERHERQAAERDPGQGHGGDDDGDGLRGIEGGHAAPSLPWRAVGGAAGAGCGPPHVIP
jgi:hypothetical protein